MQKRLFCTGDIHRSDHERFNQFEFIKDELQETDNYMIILGDFGVNFYNTHSDNIIKSFYQKMAEKYHMIFIAVRGNHERRPEDLGEEINGHFIHQYNKEKYLGFEFQGTFWIEDDYPNLYFCDNYGAFRIGGTWFYQIGGAYSVDKYYRLATGKTWIPNEQLNDQEKIDCLKDIEQYKNRTFDYVLTHTCPLQWEPRHLFLSQVDQSTVDKSMEIFLQEVEGKIKYNKWLFGHYHADEIINDKTEMLFRSIKELEIKQE